MNEDGVNEVERKISELSVLYEISSIPTVGVSESKILEVAIDKTATILRSEKCAIFLYNKEKRALVSKTNFGLGKHKITIKPQENEIWTCFSSGKQIILKHGHILLSPIKIGKRTIGILYTERTSEKFKEDELKYFDLLCLRLGSALWDITLKKKLKESEQKYRNLVENALTGIFIFQDGKFVYVNKYFEEITGYNLKDLKKIHFWEIVAPEYREIVKQRGIAREKGEKVPPRYEFKALRKDGKIIDVEVYATRIKYKGKPAVQGHAADITERKKAERLLKLEKERLNILIQSIGDGLDIVDRDYRIRFMNDALIKEFGDKVGELCYKVFQGLNEPCKDCKLRETINEGKTIKREKTLINGKTYLATSTPFRDIDGSVLRLRILKDITEKIRAEQKLRRAYQKLKEVEKLKSDIIANVSHELKTPLTIAMGMIDLANLAENEKERKEYLTRAKKALIRQNYIIDDLVAFSRVERGDFKLNIEKFNLKEIVYESIYEKREFARKKNVKIIVDVPNIEMEGDKTELKHAILCLLDNAIKFNFEGGKVIIKAKVIDGNVVVSIEDTGIGIKKKDLSKIFQPLTQLDHSERRRYGGTGMGLAVAKRVVELHSGKIWAESKYKKGTKFIFKIPQNLSVALR